MFTNDQIMGMVRVVIPVVASALSHWGLGTDAQMTSIVTAIATGAMMAWSTYAHSKDAMIQSVNAADNGVKVVPAASPVPSVDKALK